MDRLEVRRMVFALGEGETIKALMAALEISRAEAAAIVAEAAAQEHREEMAARAITAMEAFLATEEGKTMLEALRSGYIRSIKVTRGGRVTVQWK